MTEIERMAEPEPKGRYAGLMKQAKQLENQMLAAGGDYYMIDWVNHDD